MSNVTEEKTTILIGRSRWHRAVVLADFQATQFHVITNQELCSATFRPGEEIWVNNRVSAWFQYHEQQNSYSEWRFDTTARYELVANGKQFRVGRGRKLIAEPIRQKGA